MSLSRRLALGFVFLWFFIGGIGHFTSTDFFSTIVPPWWPWPREAVLVSGVFELIGALGLIPRATRSLVGWGLLAIIVLVTPAHLYMLQRPDLFPKIPYWALVARLPLQLFVLFCTWWSTRPETREARL
jgi:uncharacterized membrane protein